MSLPLTSLRRRTAACAAAICTLATAATLSPIATAEPTTRSGIDRASMQTDIKPGENFYRYANEVWLEQTKIPSDKSNYGVFTMLDDDAREKVRTIIEEVAKADQAAGSPGQKVGDFYNASLDVEARNSAGLKPIRPMIEAIGDVDDPNDLAKIAGELSQIGVNGPIGFYVNNDAKASDTYAVYVTQTGLTMPDRDYYLEDDERYTKARTALRQYISDLFKLANNEISDDRVDDVIRMETELARRQWTKVKNRDPDATYNKVDADKFNAMVETIDMRAFMSAAGMQDIKQYIVRQDTYVDQLDEVITEFELETWKDYYTLRLLNAYADGLTEAMEQRHFDFHGTVISGTTEMEPQWKRAVSRTGSVLGELVGQLYVERHFQPEAKRRMDELVENLKRAFAVRIKSRDWMGEGTKKMALEKLSKFTTKIGYPDQWKDYENLKIGDGVLADHYIAAAKFEHQRELDKLGGPIDRSEWHMTPQTINAYYNPVMNEIVFPAAILQPPFFSLDADDAVNYGAIGAVIGHEISHGFDDKGSKYNGDGNLQMWWTEQDREEFERRGSELSKQYSNYEPVEGNFVDGDLTLGENIGDLGGLSVAYEAYRLSLKGDEAPKIDGFTGDQRFFLGWAQIWRRLYRPQELLKRLVTDPHSPSEYRVNGIVRNMDAWYAAFDVKPGDELYLAPEDRVRLW